MRASCLHDKFLFATFYRSHLRKRLLDPCYTIPSNCAGFFHYGILLSSKSGFILYLMQYTRNRIKRLRTKSNPFKTEFLFSFQISNLKKLV